jgi:hypothetical protein
MVERFWQRKKNFDSGGGLGNGFYRNKKALR